GTTHFLHLRWDRQMSHSMISAPAAGHRSYAERQETAATEKNLHFMSRPHHRRRCVNSSRDNSPKRKRVAGGDKGGFAGVYRQGWGVCSADYRSACLLDLNYHKPQRRLKETAN